MSKRSMKIYTMWLIMREMQSKATLRYHLTPVRMAVIKRTKIKNSGKDMGEREHFYTISFSLIVAHLTKILHS